MKATPDSGTVAQSARARYEQLAGTRRIYEERARDAASVTIPSLFPPQGSNAADNLAQPFQSIGARGVNNVASKLLLAMLPPGQAFFRLTPTEKVIADLEKMENEQGGGDPSGQPSVQDIRGMVEASLAKMETRVMSALESAGARIIVYETLRQLFIAGNALLNVMKRGQLRYFRLDSYVVVRDGEGNVLEIIVKEELDRLTLPPHVKELVAPSEYDKAGVCQNPCVELYTRINRTKTGWQEVQEAEGVVIPESSSKYPKDKCPWLPLRFSRMAGEHYGRSYCDELMGDLRSCDKMSEAVVDFAAVASRIVFLIAPGSSTRKEDIIDAASGDAVDGKKEDVGTLQLDKYADFQVVKASLDTIEARLSAGFLLNSSVQRQAERVTAEEIRFVAQELEQGLGGIYSILAQELQHPLVVLLLAQLARDKELPPLPKDTVKPEVITGLDALGRTTDLMKWDTLFRGMPETFGQPAVSEYTNVGAILARRATALSLDTKGVIRTEDEVQAERAAQRQQSMVEKLGPEAMRQQAAQQQGQAGTDPADEPDTPTQ